MISQQDLKAGIDITDRQSISPTELMQLIGNASLNADKGIIILTKDVDENPIVPDAETYSKWKSYLWVRQQNSSITVYVWNDNKATDVTYLKWVPITVASIPDGIITNIKIADGAVTDTKIQNVSFRKLVDVPQFITSGTECSGDMEGSSFNNMTLKNQSVNASKLQADAADDSKRAVGTNHLKDQSVTLAKILKGTIAKQIIRVKADPTQGYELVSNPFTDIESIGDALQVSRVKSDKSGMEWFDPIKRYTNASAPQVMNSGAQYFTFAHGLGGKPDAYKVSFVCTANANTNLAIGATIDAAFVWSDTDGLFVSHGITADGNSIYVTKRSISSVAYVSSDSTKKTPSIANFIADFKILVTAFRYNV